MAFGSPAGGGEDMLQLHDGLGHPTALSSGYLTLATRDGARIRRFYVMTPTDLIDFDSEAAAGITDEGFITASVCVLSPSKAEETSSVARYTSLVALSEAGNGVTMRGISLNGCESVAIAADDSKTMQLTLKAGREFQGLRVVRLTAPNAEDNFAWVESVQSQLGRLAFVSVPFRRASRAVSDAAAPPPRQASSLAAWAAGMGTSTTRLLGGFLRGTSATPEDGGDAIDLSAAGGGGPAVAAVDDIASLAAALRARTGESLRPCDADVNRALVDALILIASTGGKPASASSAAAASGRNLFGGSAIGGSARFLHQPGKELSAAPDAADAGVSSGVGQIRFAAACAVPPCVGGALLLSKAVAACTWKDSEGHPAVLMCGWMTKRNKSGLTSGLGVEKDRFFVLTPEALLFFPDARSARLTLGPLGPVAAAIGSSQPAPPSGLFVFGVADGDRTGGIFVKTGGRISLESVCAVHTPRPPPPPATAAAIGAAVAPSGGAAQAGVHVVRERRRKSRVNGRIAPHPLLTVPPTPGSGAAPIPTAAADASAEGGGTLDGTNCSGDADDDETDENGVTENAELASAPTLAYTALPLPVFDSVVVSGGTAPPNKDSSGTGAAGQWYLEVDCGGFVLQANAHTEANQCAWAAALRAWSSVRRRVVDEALLTSHDL